MIESLSRVRPYVLSIGRIIVGAMFMMHGVDKIFNGVLSGKEMHLNTMMTVGGYIELIGGALIMIGLLTRLTAFICSGQMAVAYFMMHAANGQTATAKFFPSVNGGEPAVFYCFIFFYLVFAGPGPLSVDAYTLEKGG